MVTDGRGSSDWDPSHPAPGALEFVRRFINSLDLYRGRDLLADPEQATLALRDLGLLADRERVSEQDLPLARDLRELMRSLFVDDTSSPVVPAMELRVVLQEDRCLAVVPAHAGVLARLTDLFVELYVAQRDGTLSRLKACANPQCRWMFWDASRPGTGRWCSMRVCGGQHKARAYRSRHRQRA